MIKKFQELSYEVICQICGKPFKAITYSHLVSHGVTHQDYKEMYGLGVEDTMSDISRINLSGRKDYVPYSKSELKRELKKIYKKHGKLNSKFLFKKYPRIHDQIVWQYKRDFNQCYKEIGLKRSQAGSNKQWSKDEVKKVLKNYYREGWTGKLPADITSAAHDYFGSVEDALKVCKIDPGKFYEIRFYKSRADIVKVILRRKKKRKPLNVAAIRGEEGGLEEAARRIFGSWSDFFF